MEQLHAARRPSRDLVPAVLAAGAVGLVVTLVVGGSTAGIERVVPPPPGAVAQLAATPAGDAGISVRVRPARTPAITLAPADPLAVIVSRPPVGPPPSGLRTGASAVLASAPPAPAAVAALPATGTVVALASVAPVAADAAPAELASAPDPDPEPEPSAGVAAADQSHARSNGRHARVAALTRVPADDEHPALEAKTAKSDGERKATKAAKADAKAEHKAAKAEAKAARKPKR